MLRRYAKNMNIIQPSKILLFFLFISVSQLQAEQISSKELKTVLEMTTGITIPKVEKGQKGAEMITLFLSPFTFKDNAFPRKRLEEELKGNFALFSKHAMDLPTIMTAFTKQKELTDTQLLLAVRVSRLMNSQIPILEKQDEPQ